MKQRFILSAIMATVSLIGEASGDGCRRATYQPTYQQQVYKQTYVAPYVAPTYTTTAYLQVAAPVFPLYGVGYGNDEAKLLREEFLQFRKELLARDAAQQTTPPSQGGGSNLLPSVMPPAAQAAPPGLKAHRIQDKAFNAYVRANCASCHGAAPKANKLTLMIEGNDTLVDAGPLANSQIFVRMALPDSHARFMPKGGKPAPNDILDKAAELSLAP